jgi:ubiquinone/menaquinone biosynthesis C-methylase UbiE
MKANELGRSNYKGTWSYLSEDYQSAIKHVTGVASEDELKTSGKNDAKRIMKFVQPTQQDSVLEIGCGVARIGYEFANHCFAWTGCDISANMLRFAEIRLKKRANTTLVELTASDLQVFEDHSFDIVYSSVVFMHLDEWDRYHYILETYRVLKPNGRLYFDNFNLNSEQGWQTFLDHKQIPIHSRPPHISKSSTINEFEAYLANTSFIEQKVVEDGQWVVGFGKKVQECP